MTTPTDVRSRMSAAARREEILNTAVSDFAIGGLHGTSTEAIARGVGVRGLLNVQYALKDDVLYVLEANPRASRTVPFVSKAVGVALAGGLVTIAVAAAMPGDSVEAAAPMLASADCVRK